MCEFELCEDFGRLVHFEVPMMIIGCSGGSDATVELIIGYWQGGGH
jgi:hypothetical protein